MEIRTYISDVVVNTSGVVSGDTVPEAINKMLSAIDALSAPPLTGFLYVKENVVDNNESLKEELSHLLNKSEYSDEVDDTNVALYYLIKEQQKEIVKLRNSLNNISNRKNNLY